MKVSSFREHQRLKAAPPAESGPAVELLEISIGLHLVIAIDIGSDRSGYAWQFPMDFERGRLYIHVNAKWSSEGLCCYKTLKALLLKVLTYLIIVFMHILVLF
ncbi:hypothetical protein DPMN_154004 [Dreissena polymorpha]|uniref:Uncharacterized protein n=1 Tax=Dreissena polymorpha TaxID=45954 RepID=A0A9D4FLT3_DREPO|nr:hypothetical protein DPMN_154004 [Dreissena polymorpha]